MIGTVYSEDFGFLTDMSMEAANNLEDVLYPGQYASNAIGRAHRNYQNLTYESVLNTYKRYYYLEEIKNRLEEDGSYGAVLAERLESVSDKLMKKGRLVWMCAAPEDDLERIRTVSAGLWRSFLSKRRGKA